MTIDPGVEIAMGDTTHRPAMQWRLQTSPRPATTVHIQVGSLDDGGWYVRHTGFGDRRFADKAAAWLAVRRLQERHDQKPWEVVEPDSGPFSVLRRADGARILYDNQEDECLHTHWGWAQDEMWKAYESAINRGQTSHSTQTHTALNGFIELTEYTDPLDGSSRFAVVTANEEGVDYRVVDYPDYDLAVEAYEHEVRQFASDEMPFQSSDVRGVPVSQRSKAPAGWHTLPSGESVMIDDLEEYDSIYGLPIRIPWRLTVSLALPYPVRGLTDAPRPYGPPPMTAADVTDAAWRASGGPTRPHDLHLTVLPDGERMLASAHDSLAHVWRAGDDQPVRSFSGHSERVLAVALTSTADHGPVLATGGADGMARIWSVRNGSPMAEIRTDQVNVHSLAWAHPPDDIPWLITGGDDATVRAWDPERGRRRVAFRIGTPQIESVWSTAAAVLSDGHVCIAAVTGASESSTVHVWDATTEAKLHEFTVEHAPSTSNTPAVAMTALIDHSFRVAALAGGLVRVWDGHTGRMLFTLPAPQDHCGGVALAQLPDLRVAVAVSTGRSTVIWDVESGTELVSLEHPPGRDHPRLSLAALDDGGLLLAVEDPTHSPARLVEIQAAP
ncbi:WD40 repeat protein [Allocatelliglobosispora scoriae]|uniref:WD40 repeat protein n=1 Tax=Allocatelliglobosispora scoriae TaxID=643052 RepID=A0A841BHX0_9ACTN|nr:hypothetical protein [Allocatelliglobosispora scoriae]MBB5866653.1 WD40 repeat protein [Allocatelliglobosispora scoriae]